MQLVLPRVQAWERLTDYDYSGKLRMCDMYDLMMEAGYSEAVAQEVATQRGNARLDMGLEV